MNSKISSSPLNPQVTAASARGKGVILQSEQPPIHCTLHPSTVHLHVLFFVPSPELMGNDKLADVTVWQEDLCLRRSLVNS